MNYNEKVKQLEKQIDDLLKKLALTDDPVEQDYIESEIEALGDAIDQLLGWTKEKKLERLERFGC